MYLAKLTTTTSAPHIAAPAANWSEPVWIFYTVIAAAVLAFLIIAFILIDLCIRVSRFTGLIIEDGGPKPIPTEHVAYNIVIRAGSANQAFDTKNAVIRFEFLDHKNRFVTNIAVPAFVFKFQEIPASNEGATTTTTTPAAQVNPPQPAKETVASYKSTVKYVVKTLSFVEENWRVSAKAEEIKFTLQRRWPLTDVAFVRITHDCYNLRAKVTFKSIFIKDDSSPLCYRADLQNKPIRATHPCPPSGVQIFNVECISK